MSKYAILRVQKLKSPKSVRASMKHAYREQETPNADPQRTPTNDLIGAQNVREGMAAFEAALPDKIRKNAVQCVEYLVTASPGSFVGREAAQEAYLAEALRWIEKRHGKENVIASVIHRDEKTPHLCAYVVPKDPDTGRLNCRRFLGGAKALNEMQTDFARSVGQGAGLERGIEGSRATHTKLKTYYGALERDEPAPVQITPADLKPKILKKGIIRDTIEAPEDVAARISRTAQKHYEPAILSASVARHEIKQAHGAKETLKQFQKRLGPLREAVRELPLEARDQAIALCLRLIEKIGPDLVKQHRERENQRRERGTRAIARSRARDRDQGHER